MFCTAAFARCLGLIDRASGLYMAYEILAVKVYIGFWSLGLWGVRVQGLGFRAFGFGFSFSNFGCSRAQGVLDASVTQLWHVRF